MKISLFQGILMGVFVVAALIGLFVFATINNAGSPSTQIGTVVIWGTLPADGMKAFLTDATKANPLFKGISYVAKDPSAFESDLVAAIAQGDPPDLILLSQEDLLALRKVLQPIPASTVSQSSFDTAFAGGAQIFLAGSTGSYGLPFLIDPLLLYSNNSILSSDAVASPPATWEALTGLVPSVAIKQSGSAITRALIALGTYANIHNARAILSALFMQTGVPVSAVGASGGLAADLGEQGSGIPPGESVLRFYTQFADPTKVSYTWNASEPDSQASFIAGDSALYLGFASEDSFLSAANPNLDFAVSAFPQPATAQTKLTYGRIYAFAVPRGAKNASGANLAAVNLLTASLDSIAASDTGLAPSLRSLLASPPGDPLSAASYTAALYARGWLSPAPGDTDTVFNAMINNVNSGRSTLSAALSSAEGALTALMQQ